jgi:hypothetical protein
MSLLAMTRLSMEPEPAGHYYANVLAASFSSDRTPVASIIALPECPNHRQRSEQIDLKA